jgi:galactokinase
MLRTGAYHQALSALYPDVGAAVSRFERLNALWEASREGEVRLYSSPGRTEIGGNHTDHNNGRVLAGAIHLDTIALARKNDENVIRVRSAGFAPNRVDLDKPEDSKNSADRLILGICDAFRQRGLPVGGFDAVTSSEVPPGSGLSSSAAFENLICLILGDLYGGVVPEPVEMAKIGRYAENVFWQKPSGLMDQMAGALGGLSLIDFENPESPRVQTVKSDFQGYTLFIAGPIGSHAGLSDEYAAIPREMKMAALAFGKETLRGVPPEEFFRAMPGLAIPERAALRAYHFLTENERAAAEAEALRRGDVAAFLDLVNASGRSSFMYLQNVVSGTRQSLGVALAYSETLLKGRGAQRVHGGGFAGTIQAFVPDDMAAAYQSAMTAAFGGCVAARIRERGAARI